MTNQEAIEQIQQRVEFYEMLFPEGAEEHHDSLVMAVDALKMQEQATIQFDRDAVFRRCISTYGADAQIDVMIEEMSELTKALLKNRRAAGHNLNAHQNIIDEMADVKIMIRQMEILFQCEGDVERRIDFKVERQSKRLDEIGE